jgi:hypothetical protein
VTRGHKPADNISTHSAKSDDADLHEEGLRDVEGRFYTGQADGRSIETVMAA